MLTPFRNKPLITALFAFTLVFGATYAFAGSPKETHVHKGEQSSYTLLQVMQHLSAAEQQIQTGLLMNNRLMIAKGANAIADHPVPKGGIKPYIKKNHAALKGTIKAMDQQVHQTAVTLSKKAATAPMLELQALNNTMVNGCISCHNVFRD